MKLLGKNLAELIKILGRKLTVDVGIHYVVSNQILIVIVVNA